MKLVARLLPRRVDPPPRLRGSSFFVDSVDDPILQEPAGPGRRAPEVLIFVIALTTAISAAGLFGLLQLLVTGS